MIFFFTNDYLHIHLHWKEKLLTLHFGLLDMKPRHFTFLKQYLWFWIIDRLFFFLFFFFFFLYIIISSINSDKPTFCHRCQIESQTLYQITMFVTDRHSSNRYTEKKNFGIFIILIIGTITILHGESYHKYITSEIFTTLKKNFVCLRKSYFVLTKF